MAGKLSGEAASDSIAIGIPIERVRPLSGTSMSSEDWKAYLRQLKGHKTDMNEIDAALKGLGGQPSAAVLKFLGEDPQT